MADLINDTLQQLRQNALAVALRYLNLHLFGGKASEAQVITYLALRLGIEPGEVRLWLREGGVPACFVNSVLVILNEYSAWAPHQLRPNKRVALIHLGEA